MDDLVKELRAEGIEESEARLSGRLPGRQRISLVRERLSKRATQRSMPSKPWGRATRRVVDAPRHAHRPHLPERTELWLLASFMGPPMIVSGGSEVWLG